MSLIQSVCLTCHSFSLSVWHVTHSVCPSDMSLIQSVCLTCHSICLTCHSFSLSVWHVTHSVCLSDMSLIQSVWHVTHSVYLSDMSLIQSVWHVTHSVCLSDMSLIQSVCLSDMSLIQSVWHVTHSVCLSDMSLIQSVCLTCHSFSQTVWMMDCLTQTLTDWLTPQTTCPATPALWFNNMSTFLEARPDKLGHCHGCWRSQFLHHQVISNHDIDCKTSRSLSSIQNANKHVMSLWKNSACQIYLTISHLSALQMKQYLT